jgi:hypothetical protein
LPSSCQGTVRAWCCFLGDPPANYANSLPNIGRMMHPKSLEEQGKVKSCNMDLSSSRPPTTLIPEADMNSLACAVACMHVSLPPSRSLASPRSYGCTFAALPANSFSAPLSLESSSPYSWSPRFQPSATRFLPAVPGLFGRLTVPVCLFPDGVEWSGGWWVNKVGARL